MLATALLSVAVAPGVAFAQSDQDRATARELGQKGQEALDAHDYKRAEESFRRAEGLFHAPTLLLGLARSQAGQGRVVEAWENYHRIILENNVASPIFAKAVADAQAEIGSVESKRSRVTISAPGSDAPKVTIDDVPVKTEALGVERFIDPGQHVFKATADGFKPVSQVVTIREASVQTVTLTLERDPNAVVAATPTPVPGQPGTTAEATSSGNSWMKPAAIVSYGVGGAGLLEGIITGILAISKHSTLSGECKNGTCPNTSSVSSDLSSYHTVGALSTVGFIVAGVGAAAGTTFLLVAPKQPSTTGLSVTPYVGFGAAGATGTF